MLIIWGKGRKFELIDIKGRRGLGISLRITTSKRWIEHLLWFWHFLYFEIYFFTANFQNER